MQSPWSDRQWKERWDLAFAQTIGDEVRASGTTLEEWKVSGRATKANPNKEDQAWWWGNGMDIARTYETWRLANPQYVLWSTPDGTPGCELDFTVLFGSVPVRVIIDRVFIIVTGDGQEGPLIVVDVKSGRNMPEDLIQLLIYAAAIDLKYGKRPNLGAYFDARRGGLVSTECLDEFSTMEMVELVENFVTQREGDIHLPNPGRQCTWCEVRKHCKWGKAIPAHLRRTA